MASITPKKGTPTSNVSGTGVAGRRQPPGSTTSPSPTPGATARGPSPASNVLSTNGVARNSSIKASPGIGRPARPSARKSGSSVAGLAPSSAEDIVKAEEAKAESAALMENLKKSLRDAEAASEDYQNQLAAAQQKVDDLMADHTKLEEQYHEGTEKIEELEFEKRESKRHAQEMERIYESERVAIMKDREDSSKRESDLKSTIQRLKENVAGREVRNSIGSEQRSPRQGRSPSRGSPKVEEGSPFAPPGLPRSDSQGTSRLVMQKDQIIEGLRLELAEAQIKLVEMENMGGDRVQDLERQLLETRMTNARLMEDNDSFQLLLGERTISGDFQKTELMQSNTSGLGSLAEELESAEGESANYRRVEGELRSQKDQNKALTLYIEKIISRVLQHDNFETILDQKGGLGLPPGSSSSGGGRDKELPPPPAAKDEPHQESFMQRATSVVRRQRPVSAMFTGAPGQDDSSATATPPANLSARRPRPQSVYVAPTEARAPTANEDPTTAPSIPLGRAGSVAARSGGGSGVAPGAGSGTRAPSGTHRRNLSDTKSPELPGAAGIVNQMYRGPPSGTGAPITPLSPGSASRSYFSPMKPRAGTPGDAAAAGQPPAPPRSSTSTPPPPPPPLHSSPPRSADRSDPGLRSSARPSSGGSGGAANRLSVDGVATARPSSSGAGNRPSSGGVASSVAGGAASSSSELSSPPRDRAGNTQYTGAVMAQNRLRPLRLVQESGGEDAAAVEARKKANRGSWMGWFNRGKDEGGAGSAGLGLGGVGGFGGLERTEE